MFYLIIGFPVTAAVAAMQFLICEKAKKNITKLLPIFAAAAVLLLAAFIPGENLIADAVYGIAGQGIFAIIVLLWIFGGAMGLGAIIGWVIYLIKNRAKR